VLRNSAAAFPTAEIVGHRNLDPRKPECPAFDVKKWWAEVQERYHDSD